MRPAPLGTLVVFAFALAAPASAGTLSGRIVVRSAAPAAAPELHAYPGQASAMANARRMPRGLVSDAVVFVQTAPASADSIYAVRAKRPELRQRNECFEPRVVAIATGGSVDFPNDDPVYHNVFSPSPVKRFDLGKYPKGQSRRVTFARAGLVNVFCDIHSHMQAFVLVIPHPVFARPDREGNFTLPDLPAGRYRVRVWHPDFTETERDVDVPDQGEARTELAL